MEKNQLKYNAMGSNNHIQNVHKEVGKEKTEQEQTANEHSTRQRGERRVDIRRMTKGEWVEEEYKTAYGVDPGL